MSVIHLINSIKIRGKYLGTILKIKIKVRISTRICFLDLPVL